MSPAAALRSLLRRLLTVDAARLVLRKLKETPAVEQLAWARGRPIEPDLVLYESFAGNGMLCNPEAIFRALLADPMQQHLKHVWVLDDPSRHPETVREFADDSRVRFVKRGSFAYTRALATAQLLFNNATFPAQFSKRPGQVYVNTWHGTPLKTMGYDEPQGAFRARNVLRNFMMADYLLSTCQFMSERMYEQAYRLINVAPGKIIEEGYPRTDRQYLDTSGRARLIARLREVGVRVADADRVVLYAPTWRGESFHAPLNDARQLAERLIELQDRLPEGWKVLVKTHQQVSQFGVSEPALQGRLVPNSLPTNEVLGVADVLVTDYSSIFFDYLATGRPVIFFTPDQQDYEAYRGWYVDRTELPGPAVSTLDELASVVSAAGDGSRRDPLVSHKREYAAARDRFSPHEDGGVTERVLDVVLRGSARGRKVRPIAKDGRPTLLIYLGGLKSNGITTSGMNLLQNLDHESYDISVIYNQSPDQERMANATLIDPRVRQFIRIGGFAAGKRNYLRLRQLLRGGIDRMPAFSVAALDALLTAEWRRTVGTAHFDHVIDFSGYSPLWAYLVSNASAESRSIWMHNDLKADQMRVIQGGQPHRSNLTGVFSAYRRFDHLVSVSSALRDINGRNLAKWAARERFTFARNTIDYKRVLRAALDDPPSNAIPCESSYTFVSVGRLSPEKNHRRLLGAFAMLRAEHPRAALVIIGDGPLRKELEDYIVESGLQDRVRLAGLQPNPWSIMSRCNAFVLSSDYEGQPMVILEARTLGLPIITTRFESVTGALTDRDGLIVDRDVASLAAGMITFCEMGIKPAAFDPKEYNCQAVAEFLTAIQIRTGQSN